MSGVEPVRAAALAAALSFATEHGLAGSRGLEPVVLADGANVVVHLSPAPVVVKVAATTLAVRPDAEQWLAREVAVAGHVAAMGLPVVRQSDLLPAGVHCRDGIPLSCWELVPTRPGRLSAAATAGMLADLHAALRSYRGELPYLGTPRRDIARFLDRGSLPTEQLARLRAGWEALTPLLAGPVRVLHGDPHPGNLLLGPSGWLWCDFEDTCAGPVEWDLSALVSSRGVDGPAALTAYQAAGGEVGDLTPWLALRRLHVVVWYCLYAERLPRHVASAAQRLDEWLAAAAQ